MTNARWRCGALAVVALVGAWLVGCQGPKSPAGGPASPAGGKAAGAPTSPGAGEAAGVAAKPAGKITLGYLVKRPEEDWFIREWHFAQQCADKYEFELMKIGAPDGGKLINAIDTLAASKVQGFVVCTPDVKLGPAIVEKAAAAGMKVFAVDDQFIDAQGKPMADVPYMGISASEIGKMVGQAMADESTARAWKPEDTGALLVTFDELETGKYRTEGAAESLIAAGFPERRIFRVPEKTTDTTGGYNAGQTAVTQHPEIRQWLVCSLNDEGVLGAVRAMEGAGLTADNVVGVGIGGTKTAQQEFAKPGRTGFFSTCLISPYRHGYEATELLYKWVAEGAEPPKETLTKGTMIDRDNYVQVLQEQGLLEVGGGG